jgi:hypothetical protein
MNVRPAIGTYFDQLLPAPDEIAFFLLQPLQECLPRPVEYLQELVVGDFE